MIISVILTDSCSNYIDRVDINNPSDKYHFSYIDNQGCKNEMHIYEDGLCLNRANSDYSLELYLRDKSYAKITTSEGVIEINAKVVDFIRNDDILVMRYHIDDVERKIEILYRS